MYQFKVKPSKKKNFNFLNNVIRIKSKRKLNTNKNINNKFINKIYIKNNYNKMKKFFFFRKSLLFKIKNKQKLFKVKYQDLRSKKFYRNNIEIFYASEKNMPQ